MRKILILIGMIVSMVYSVELNAQDIEILNVEDDTYFDVVHGINPIREINGGTVFNVDFSEDCPVQMQGAFEYACKLLEEYIPSCMPIKVKVDIEPIRTSNKGNLLSKVSFASLNNYIEERNDYYYHPTTKVKYVLLDEYLNSGAGTFNYLLPEDCSFLRDEYDISITYNENMLDEFSYTLEELSRDKYDFITIALRDLLRGLGLYNGFTTFPGKSELTHPEEPLTDFEILTNKSLGDTTPSERYIKATSGELIIGSLGLKLFAPKVWDSQKSLKYFVPDSLHQISQVLSYEFGKGCVYRNINDKHSFWLFRELLNWRREIVTGGQSSSSYDDDSTTENIFPYKGIVTVPTSNTNYQIYSQKRGVSSLKRTKSERFSLFDYMDRFHPGKSINGEIKTYNATMSILREDGTWDVVYETPYYNFPDFPDITFDMNDFVFHESDGPKYARTCDGFLRAKITLSYEEDGLYGPVDCFASKYYVMDYTPQQIEIDYRVIDSPSTQLATRANTNQLNISIGLKNVAGMTKVVLEKRINNARLPVKYIVTNFKEGNYETTCPSFGTTSFVAVGYNENGSTRSEPIVITPESSATLAATNIKQVDNRLVIDNKIAAFLNECEFEISSVDQINENTIKGHISDNFIDITNLSRGLHILRFSNQGQTIASVKFFKY